MKFSPDVQQVSGDWSGCKRDKLFLYCCRLQR